MCAPPPDGQSKSSGGGDVSGEATADVREGDTRFTGASSVKGVGDEGNNAFTGEWMAGILKKNPLLERWLEDEIHEMETSVGYDIPGQGQIVEDDPAFLSKFGGMINLRGSVFSIPFIYWQFVALLCFALLYAWAAGPMPAVIDVMGMQVPP